MSDTMIVMDTKSKILFGVFGILILLSVSASYYRFMVLHDYLVQAEVDCDPTYESCFVWECDPEEDEECTGDPEEDTWYYKIAYRNAKNTSNCEDGDMVCQFTCPIDGEEECKEVLCSNETIETYNIDGECTNPVDFQDEIIDDEDGEVDEEELSDEQADTTEEIE